jgi:hypothetical protein
VCAAETSGVFGESTTLQCECRGHTACMFLFTQQSVKRHIKFSTARVQRPGFPTGVRARARRVRSRCIAVCEPTGLATVSAAPLMAADRSTVRQRELRRGQCSQQRQKKARDRRRSAQMGLHSLAQASERGSGAPARGSVPWCLAFSLAMVGCRAARRFITRWHRTGGELRRGLREASLA